MSTAIDVSKRSAGRRAADFVSNGQVVGLGTGSTVYFTLERLAERIREENLEIRGVPTSVDTESKARTFGIPLSTLAETPEIDVTIDGADEIDGAFDMIKGGGGALLREKVVASVSREVVIVVGANKVVERLGTTFDLPVEVVPFARAVVINATRRLGAAARPRERDGKTYLTDNGNEILDLHFDDGIEDASALESSLARVAGVVESGLFIGLCDAVVIGSGSGAAEVRRR